MSRGSLLRFCCGAWLARAILYVAAFTRTDYDTVCRCRGLQFMRTLMVECLKLEHNGSRIVRRTQRHTPVRWTCKLAC